MNQFLNKIVLPCIFLLLFQSWFYKTNCQTETNIDGTKKYDEILNKDEVEKPLPTPQEESKQTETQPQQEATPEVSEGPKEVIDEKNLQGTNELTISLRPLNFI